MSKTEPQSSNIISETLCLNRLGAHLLQFYPLSQVQESLADYQEYLSLRRERGTSAEGLLQELKNPTGILKELLNEMPKGRRFFLLWTGGWGAVLLFTLYLCYQSLPCYVPLMGILSLSLFALLHGRARAVLEQQLGAYLLRRSFWLLQLLPLVLTSLTEYAMQKLLVQPPESIPTAIGVWRIGPVINTVLCSLVFLLVLLLIWTLFQIRTRSIRYYPGVVHILGTIFFLLDTRSILHRMDLDFHNLEIVHREFLLPLCWYGIGLLLALLFAFLLKPGKIHKFQTKE